MERTIVSQLQNFLHENDDLVCLFKTEINLMSTDSHKIVTSAEKTPNDKYLRRYNAPTLNELAIFMVYDQF